MVIAASQSSQTTHPLIQTGINHPSKHRCNVTIIHHTLFSQKNALQLNCFNKALLEQVIIITYDKLETEKYVLSHW